MAKLGHTGAAQIWFSRHAVFRVTFASCLTTSPAAPLPLSLLSLSLCSSCCFLLTFSVAQKQVLAKKCGQSGSIRYRFSIHFDLIFLFRFFFSFFHFLFVNFRSLFCCFLWLPLGQLLLALWGRGSGAYWPRQLSLSLTLFVCAQIENVDNFIGVFKFTHRWA